MILTNAFSLNMLAGGLDAASVQLDRLDVDEARATLAGGFRSAVGHADTAAVFSAVLGVPVPCDRATVILDHGDTVLVGQYTGPRLEAGATALPPGATIVWWLCRVAAPAELPLATA